jgi:DNA (cytosine-5)-methyltransferase 1
MSAYYNEIEPMAADWLLELMADGLIAEGEVDTRSIEDVTPNELTGFTQCHFFAGIGGWSYALRLAGWPDDRPVWTGSCPCQPFSAAGKGAGTDDERHLWPAFHWLIRQCSPSVVVGEQVASKSTDEWYELVQADVEAMGYAFGAVPFPAASIGAPFTRDRGYWIATHPNTEWDEQSRQKSCGRPPGRMGRFVKPMAWEQHWKDTLSQIRASCDGIPRRVWACDGARNAIVPQQAAAFISAIISTTPIAEKK